MTDTSGARFALNRRSNLRSYWNILASDWLAIAEASTKELVFHDRSLAGTPEHLYHFHLLLLNHCNLINSLRLYRVIGKGTLCLSA